MLEILMVQNSNPTMQGISFSFILLNEDKSIESFFIHLNSGARDYNFTSPVRKHVLSD